MKPTHVIIHHSLTKDGKTVSWNAIRHYHTKVLGWDDIGYHYGVELIGEAPEILCGRMLDRQGAHCRGHNRNSLGICFVGNFDYGPPPAAQLRLGAKLVASLMRVFDIPANRVKAHRDFNSGKTCPGLNFNMDVFRSLIKGY